MGAGAGAGGPRGVSGAEGSSQARSQVGGPRASWWLNGKEALKAGEEQVAKEPSEARASMLVAADRGSYLVDRILNARGQGRDPTVDAGSGRGGG